MELELGFPSAMLSSHHAQSWRRTAAAIYQRAQYVHRPRVVAACVAAAGRAMRHGKGGILERLRDARVELGIVTSSDFSNPKVGRRFMAWGERVIDVGLSEDEAVELARELDEFLLALHSRKGGSTEPDMAAACTAAS